MKKLPLLCTGALYSCLLAAQPSFQTSVEAGIALPLGSNEINETHAGKAIHFGSHYDYSFGSGSVRVGLGAYIGYLNSLAAANAYKENGEAIAEKYRFSTANLSFNSTAFKSTQILLGPVASFGSGKCSFNVWAKAGYGFNEPSRYAVLYKENGVTNNIYVNQSGENKNGLAYTAGAGIRYALSEFVGFKLSANYFSTQTDQVNFNFEREKGIAPKYYTAANQFIQGSAGLQFNIGAPAKSRRSNGNDYGYSAYSTDTASPVARGQKIKTKSNIKNDRLRNPDNNDAGDDPYSDSLYFSPEKIILRSKVSSERVPLRSVDNYLTGFVYQSANGAVVSQCGPSEMQGEPIPGIDVRLRRVDGNTGDAMTTKTNRDGSFAFNNIAPGNYRAETGNSSMDVAVKSNRDDAFKLLNIYGSSCDAGKENFMIAANDKTYVEVIATGLGDSSSKKVVAQLAGPRDAATGMSSGRRMHKPYRVANTEFEVNMENIVSDDGKLYAEVISSRETGSGMATGRRVLITGDIDGDGIAEQEIVSPRDAASGLPTGKRMHKPFVITKELDSRRRVDLDSDNDAYTDRDAAGGIATGKRMHKPFVVTKQIELIAKPDPDSDNDGIADRDAASGMAGGKRMHKPFVITKEINITEEEPDALSTPGDASSGMATGRRMHKPFVITIDEDMSANEIVSPRDAASGMPTGRRQYAPIVIRIDPEENAYQLISPRDPASGMATGKRMHKPLVITKELGYTADGNQLVKYKLVWCDPHEYAANNDAGEEANDGYLAKKGYDYYKAQSEMAAAVVSNPLYQGSGNSGTNPLYEGKDALHITGSNGKDHDIFLPANISIVRPVNNPPLAESVSYGIEPIKWMAPESMAAKKGITEKGIRKNDAVARKGWDGSVKGSGRNIIDTPEDAEIQNDNPATAARGHNEKGIKRTGVPDADIISNDPLARAISTRGVKRTDDAARKGWDGTVKGGSAMVKEISRINCTDGSCMVEALVEADGVTYEATISGVLKTRHETAKNSISNVR